MDNGEAVSPLPQPIIDFFQCHKLEILSIDACKSAQHEVWIVQISSAATMTAAQVKNGPDIANDGIWMDCLQMGQNRVVVRQWKGGCQWWNLHQNSNPPQHLAQTEIHGYEWSYKAFLRHSSSSSSSVNIIIPRVLYHSIPNVGQGLPWAIMEYVGPESLYFDDSERVYDSTFLDGMVKERLEYGFVEPHPRWGRVPEDQALDYATMVLDQVVIPLHKGFQNTGELDQDGNQSSLPPPSDGSYQCMISRYQDARLVLLQAVKDYPHYDDKMTKALALVQDAIETTLPSNLSQIPPLLPVLVHLDLQPQNLLLAKCHSSNGTSSSSSSQVVRAVLDWEDAAIADPRFEILMLGCKVCANREQGETIWKRYADKMSIASNGCANGQDSDNKSILRLGPLRPWLQLQCLHNILILLLQSANALHGGRNPWETSQDTWGKLEREMFRWDQLLAENRNEEECILK